jgi:hypothetical protein
VVELDELVELDEVLLFVVDDDSEIGEVDEKVEVDEVVEVVGVVFGGQVPRYSHVQVP